ncbi:MAG: hypothetical protein MJ168_08310 [Clostridia bacterium]|nr:hypothetical protein [Clostridia bacterium]
MSKLPLNGAQYDKVIALADFIDKSEKLIKLNEIRNYKFTPKIDGYEMFVEHNGYELNVEIILHKNSTLKSVAFSAVIKNNENGKITKKKFKLTKGKNADSFAESLFEICGWKTE